MLWTREETEAVTWEGGHGGHSLPSLPLSAPGLRGSSICSAIPLLVMMISAPPGLCWTLVAASGASTPTTGPLGTKGWGPTLC